MDKKMFNELLDSVKEMDAIAAAKKSHPGFGNRVAGNQRDRQKHYCVFWRQILKVLCAPYILNRLELQDGI